MTTSKIGSGYSKFFACLSRYVVRISASVALFGMITACGGGNGGTSNAGANTLNPLLLFSGGMPGSSIIPQALAATASAQIPEAFVATCNFSGDIPAIATPLLVLDEGISDTHGADGCPSGAGFIRVATPTGAGIPVFTAGTITTLTAYGVIALGFGALTCTDTVHTAPVNDKQLIQAYFNDVTGEVFLAADGVKLPLTCTIGQVPPVLLNITVRWAKI